MTSITRSLAAIAAPGSFAYRGTTNPDDLRLEVKGVGPVEWPISIETARALRGVARRAGFGWRDQTLVDESVRNTWEIAKTRVKIDKRKWNRTLIPQLQQIKKRLGLPTDGKLAARLYKMLLYQPGQFFVPHQDSEKSDNMIGTLTVTLPSMYSGGSTSIEHRGQKVTYRPSRSRDRSLTFVAFYSDCHHEVRPITDGHRVVLVYDLVFDEPAMDRESLSLSLSLSGMDETLVHHLELSVDKHFKTSIPARYSTQPTTPPDKLVYLLDHEYTQKSLGWNRLKNGDRFRALALRQVAQRLDCEIFLALADVHELWSCEGDDYYDGWGYHGRYRSRDHEKDPESYQLIELHDWGIELRHWLDSNGKSKRAMRTAVSSEELCYTKPSVEFDPFQSEHEGWMGNHGNTIDRWYHRAAVIMWPRSNTFMLRARMAPLWGVNQLLRLVRKRAREEALAKAHTLTPFWFYCARGEARSQFVERTCELASALDDAELASQLLAPFHLGQIDRSSLPHVLEVLKAHGQEWGWELYTKWMEALGRFGATDGETSWFAFMPTFCTTLHEQGHDHGRQLATRVIDDQWSRIKERCVRQLDDVADPDAVKELSTLSKKIAPILQSCVAVGNRDVHDGILAFLMASNVDYPVLCLTLLLREDRERHASDGDVEDVGQPDLAQLHRHCVSALQSQLAGPARAADDWSITVPMKCQCNLCEQLGDFLAHRERVRYNWPLAKDGRRHIHNQIERYKLPVTHNTRRSGRPYVLMLAKTKELFKRDSALRQTYERELAWLTQERRRG